MNLAVDNARRRTLTFLAIVLFSLFALLIVQFFKTQMIEGEKWTQMGNLQHYFTIKEPARRGIFYSGPLLRREHPEEPEALVADIEKFHLIADPQLIPTQHREAIIIKLSTELNLPKDQQASLYEQLEKKSRRRKLSMWLEEEVKTAVGVWWEGFAKKQGIPRNALFFERDFQRSYPFGKLLGQVLHTLRHQKDENDNVIPTGGLELYFNKVLTGRGGRKRMLRSPHNAMDTGEMITLPEQGADVYLSINHTLQAIAEEELESGVKRFGAKGGWVVMMDPFSGEILALAQYPFFYVTDYIKYFNNSELIEHTRVKAVSDAHEPGSVVKPLTFAIALKANEELIKRGRPPLFDPEEKISTSSGFFPGRTKELKDLRVHHYMNMAMAIQKSANIYPAKIVKRIVEQFGDNWYRQMLTSLFGIGQKTGIELPGETKGVLPTPGKMHANGSLEWSKPTPYSLAMGHNLQVNSIQLVRAFSVLANGGYLIEPTLVRKIVKGNTLLLDNTSKRQIESGKQVLSKEIVGQIVTALKYVTKPRGSAPSGDIWGYTEVGKSGTAEKIVEGHYSKQRHISSFIGFTPINEPAFVLLITLDEPEVKFLPGIGKQHMGGVCASPIFRAIASRSLEYMGIKQDDPFGFPIGDPRYQGDKAHWIKEARLLQEKYEKWNNIRDP